MEEVVVEVEAVKEPLNKILPQLMMSNQWENFQKCSLVKWKRTAYLCLNVNVAGFNSPIKKIAFTVTLMKGPEVTS